MSKKLTIKKALQETERIWAQLAESGGNKLGIDSQYLHGCPCCELVSEKLQLHGRMDCATGSYGLEKDRALAACPMRAVWPKGCQSENSPYQRWRKTLIRSDDRKAFAARIAAGARRLLGKLEAREAKKKAKVAK